MNVKILLGLWLLVLNSAMANSIVIGESGAVSDQSVTIATNPEVKGSIFSIYHRGTRPMRLIQTRFVFEDGESFETDPILDFDPTGALFIIRAPFRNKPLMEVMTTIEGQSDCIVIRRQ